MKVIAVAAARPNFMKIGPIYRALRLHGRFEPLLVHTGQHYDPAMSKVFFDDLGLPEPDVYLSVGSGTHAEQTAAVMTAFEKVCDRWRPDVVLVVGDVNSTLACALVAAKLPVPVAHVEAGLRSGDWTMPEEVNRVLTDRMSHWLFTPDEQAGENLQREGLAEDRIHLVGNVMIDSLVAHLDRSEAAYVDGFEARWPRRGYAVVTLHRPSNVDDGTRLERWIDAVEQLSDALPVIFPVHPRTRARLNGRSPRGAVQFVEPLGYLQFLGLMRHARLVLTDSGGIQEETSYMGVPCVTARDNTERPVTIALGTNVLAGSDPAGALAACRDQLSRPKVGGVIPMWDGRTAERIVDVLARTA